MKPYDIYKVSDEHSHLLGEYGIDEAHSFCVIRGFRGDKVIFSIPQDKQPRFNEGIIIFESTTYVMNRSVFEKNFTHTHFIYGQDGE